MNRKARRTARQRPARSVGTERRKFLDEAMSQHQAGRLDQARKLYLRELKFDPDNVDALHYLGTLLYQQGDPSQAMDLIKKAPAINPAIAEAYSNLGAVLAALGKTDEAVTAHRRAIGL